MSIINEAIDKYKQLDETWVPCMIIEKLIYKTPAQTFYFKPERINNMGDLYFSIQEDNGKNILLFSINREPPYMLNIEEVLKLEF